MTPLCLLSIVLLAAAGLSCLATEDRPSDAALTEYFRAEVAALEANCLSGVRSLEEWERRKPEYRRQLLEMLGLWPLPQRTDLHATTTGTLQRDDFSMERVHFQSMPGLYVTGNLYLPKPGARPAPAVLYVCGHGNVKRDGVSYGAKAAYQHHGAWLARNGYVCLVIDTVELGEIEGNHHGTYRDGRWWWNSRGYTPAGVETWNSLRAVDYLLSRPEVDGGHIGITGRSGGGAYSWFVAAVDERVKAAVPVAGITDLRNHVVDGCVEGHCDCMYPVNTYRWDFPLLAALVAPRPLLIANSDKDTIFPLEGVVRLHAKVREVYRLHKAEDKLGLLITEGPHEDTQDLQVPALRWFNRHLKGEDPLVETAAAPAFQPEELRVFSSLPADQRNTRIDESFVPLAAPPELPDSAAGWARLRDSWRKALAELCFRGWPLGPAERGARRSFSAESDGLRLSAYDFTSQPHVPLRLYMLRTSEPSPVTSAALSVLDEPGWKRWLSAMRAGFPEGLGPEVGVPGEDIGEEDAAAFRALRETLGDGSRVLAWLVPRGIGPGAWSGDERKQTQIRRRFMLLGQTLDGMRVWDVRQAVRALRETEGAPDLPVRLEAEGEMAANALYASLWEEGITDLTLRRLPASHSQGPDYLNVLRVLDIPQALAVAAERCRVAVDAEDPARFAYASQVAERLGWGPDRLCVRPAAEAE